MDTIFSISDDVDDNENVDIDELYERNMKRSKDVLTLYNNILRRIHSKIRNTSRASKEQHIWYLVPEVIVGIHYYNQMDCIRYILERLTSNGFRNSYTHPNLIFVTWNHWVPNYVRSEWSKKTGKKIDNYGAEIKDEIKSPSIIKNTEQKQKTQESIYKDISAYVPTGKFK